MATYSDEFKAHAVHLLYKLKKEGTVKVDLDLYVNNVRELVAFLDISSYSLYKWVKKFEYEGNLGDEKIEVFTEKDLVEELVDLKKELDDFVCVETKHEIPEQNGDMTFKMGTTFFQTLAQGLGIKNYRMPLEQLYLTIGNALVKKSGLTENGKLVRKELRIE